MLLWQHCHPCSQNTLLQRGQILLHYQPYDSKNVLAYRLTKPFKLGGSYNGEGVLNFVLTECNTEDSDNIELHIANYYDHFPKEKPDEPDTPSGGNTPDVPDGKKVWF